MALASYFRGEIWGGVFRTRNWIAIGFGVAAISLGLWGFSTCTATDCKTHSFGEKLFRTIDLIRLSSHYSPDHDPWALVIAQFMMPLALVFGAVRLFVVNMRRDLKVVMVRRMRGHMIVCGLGDTGLNIAQQLAHAGYKVVAISLDNQDANALACERRGIVVLRGDAMEQALLYVAGVRRAACLFITCGSDAVNIEIGLRANAVKASRGTQGPLNVWIELRYDWLYGAILRHRSPLALNGTAQIRLFNLHTNAARLLVSSAGFRKVADQTQVSSHMLALGHGPALNEVVAQAAQGPFAMPGRNLSVTILSEKAQTVQDAMTAKYPGLSEVTDLSLEDVSFDDTGWPGIARIVSVASPALAVVDLVDEVDTMRVALRLRGLLDDAGLLDTPVFTRVWRQGRLGEFLHGLEWLPDQPDRLSTFGDLETLTRPDQLLEETIDLRAIAAHEAYRQGSGDNATPEWAGLSEQAKQSNRDFADHISTKLAEIPLSNPPKDDEIERLAKSEHWRWMQSLKLRGWRYGPRDEVRKLHPLITDWADLEERARETNREMVRRIPAIIALSPDRDG